MERRGMSVARTNRSYAIHRGSVQCRDSEIEDGAVRGKSDGGWLSCVERDGRELGDPAAGRRAESPYLVHRNSRLQEERTDVQTLPVRREGERPDTSQPRLEVGIFRAG